MSPRPTGTRCKIARTRTGSGFRRSNLPANEQGAVAIRGGAFVLAAISASRASVHLGLAGVGDDLLEFRHAEHAGHAIFADDEGRGAAEAEGLGLVVVALEDGIDVLGAVGEIMLQTIYIDASGREQFVDARLGQARADAHHGVVGLMVLVLIFGRERD